LKENLIVLKNEFGLGGKKNKNKTQYMCYSFFNGLDLISPSFSLSHQKRKIKFKPLKNLLHAPML
jgi:hypothetical protein